MSLDGATSAEIIRNEIREEIREHNLKITLAIFYAGNNPASAIYVNNKVKACDEVGIKSIIYRFDENVSQGEIINKVKECNEDKNINGIMVQLPLPSHIDEEEVVNSIRYDKDVDGLGIVNQGNLFKGNQCIQPATAKGIITLLKHNNINIKGMNACVIGRSILVGKPVSILLLNENATVTMCHSKTVNLKEITKRSDIVVVAVGKPKFLTADMVKKDAVVVDVGISRVDGKVCGDVDFENVIEVASYVSPVPKGVGPMTIATLLQNVVECYHIQERNE